MQVAVENLTDAGLTPMRASLEAARAITTVWALAACAESLGHWPTQVEYAEHWQVSDRSAQREWADFRRAFPDEETPDRLAQVVRANVIGQRLKRASAAFGVPFEAPAVAA